MASLLSIIKKPRHGYAAVAIGLALVALGVASLFALLYRPASLRSAPPSSTADFGFTYMRITPTISACYDLGVDSGALVTEVVPDSPAARAGIRAGDIIVSFNGRDVEAGMPLLGMMRSCPEGSTVELQVRRNKAIQVVEMVHPARGT